MTRSGPIVRAVVALLAAAVATAACSQASRALAGGRLGCRLQRPRFRTLPALQPTGFCVVWRRGAARPAADLLVTPRPDPRKDPGKQFGLMILAPDGKLLWYQRRPTKVHDLKVVPFRGQRMLAFFQQAGRHGYYQLLDQRYRPVIRITAGNGYSTNLHELQMTGDGTAWVSADVRVRRPGLGTVIEYVVQRVDAETGRVLFEWQSIRHVAPSTSYERRPPNGGKWDYFHGNSVDPPRGRSAVVIISSRNTSSLYGVDPRTGRVRWVFGGKRDQFGLARHPSWFFCAQHDAHRLANGDIMIFDNGGSDMNGSPRCPRHAAQALEFRLDVARRTVRLVRRYSSRPLTRNGRGFFSRFVGSARPLPNGGAIVDWGNIPRVSLFGSSGREDGLLRLEFWSYRAIAAPWQGRPLGLPAIATRRRGGRLDVWASWNGATDVERWQVLAGERAGALAPVGRPVPFAGLETHLTATTSARYVAVRALAGDGAVLAQSATAVPRS